MVANATRLFTVDEANSLLELINPIIIELSDYSVKQEMLEEQLEEIMEEVKDDYRAALRRDGKNCKLNLKIT